MAAHQRRRLRPPPLRRALIADDQPAKTFVVAHHYSGSYAAARVRAGLCDDGETFFLAQAFRLAAREGVRGIVSFSDPMPRVRADGTVLSPGHVGTIYQAANGWHTADRGTPRTLLVGPDGRVLSDRALSKIRRQEPGYAYAERQLVGYGARPRQPAESPAWWLDTALTDAGIRRVRHPGNHRYLFRIRRTRAERSRVRFALPNAPYPKKETAA